MDNPSKDTDRNSQISTQQKALEINLDASKYGTFVEIGAGQEVARQFFSAGAAAGTVAKTMSAYDMQISDVIYGKAGAYVSRQRLEQMLSREFNLLNDRLGFSRGESTEFFSYAATVTAKSFQQKNECHGWIGVQMGSAGCDTANEIIMHVRMLDEDNQSQAEALGILGVNLLYGGFYYRDNPKWIIDGLLDQLDHIDSSRLEIDLINFSGPAFKHIDNRLMNLHLVRSWCCRAVMFTSDGNSVDPASALRKKDVMVIRGSFKPPTKVHMDMQREALKQFSQLDGLSDRGILNVAELSMSELASGGHQADEDFLARVDLLVKLGFNVLISDYLRYFRLRSWMRNFTSNRIAIVISAHDFNPLFDDNFYQGLEGGILVAMGKLFSDQTHVYVYPAKINDTLVTLHNAEVIEKNRYLVQHLIQNKSLLAVEQYNEENLHIHPRRVLEALQKGRGDWEQGVPEIVAREIIEQSLFGFGSEIEAKTETNQEFKQV